jgi:hypothetical protein
MTHVVECWHSLANSRFNRCAYPLVSRFSLPVLLVGVAVLTACNSEASTDEVSLWGGRESSPIEREIVSEQWDTLWTRVGGPRDTLLMRPLWMAASDAGLHIYDGGANRLLAFDPYGRVRWTFGRKGPGPSEFRGVRDIKVTPGGDILVLDPRNSRITRLTPDGRVRTQIPLRTAGHAEQMVALDRDRILLLTTSPTDPFVIIDQFGKVGNRFTLPWEGFDRLHPIARQGYLAGENGRWVFGFSMGNGWFAYEDTAAAPFVGQYVEHTEFPQMLRVEDGDGVLNKMAEYSACSGCSISLTDSMLYVHFGGYTPYHLAVVDRYTVSSGQYQGSYLLPAQARAISISGNTIYALIENPYPTVLALRPRRGTDRISTSIGM